MILELTGFPLVLVAIIAFIIIIGLVIILHEMGHLFFAKKAGILCHEFSIGMGPVIYKKKKGETWYRVRAIPLGGYVSMAGEEITDNLVKIGDEIGLNLESEEVSEIILDNDRDAQVRGKVQDIDLMGVNGGDLFITIDGGIQGNYYKVKRNAEYVFEKDKRMQITPYDRSFDSKSLPARMLTIVAGPIMNFILAMVIYIIASFASGVPNYGSNVVGTVQKNSPAAEILEVGDKITAINGNKCNTWTEFQTVIDEAYQGYKTELVITYEHNGVETSKKVNSQTIINSIGISDIGAIENPFDKGAVLGTTSARYKDANKTGVTKLKTNDVIVGIEVDGIEKNIDSWNDLIKEFTLIKSASQIRFKYYTFVDNNDNVIDQNDYKLIDYNDCGLLETYTDEVLNNQRIEKIRHYIGVSPEMHVSFFGCIGQAFANFGSDFTLIFRTLKLLIAPSDVRQIGVGELSSFVGIFEMVKTYIGAGIVPLMLFAAMLSVNIGVMNLLPIPALDGGRFCFLLYELITRKKPSKKVETVINNIFFILLLILLVFVTFNDVLRIFRR